MTDDEKTVAELQTEESKLWAELEDVCEEYTLMSISKLIEVNIELEKLCNQ